MVSLSLSFCFVLLAIFILMRRQRYSLPFQMCIFLVVLLLPSANGVRCTSVCFVSLVSYINVVRIWFDTSFCLVATFIAVYCFYFHLSVLFFCTICCFNIIFRTVSLAPSLATTLTLSPVNMFDVHDLAHFCWVRLKIFAYMSSVSLSRQ